jgi:hypothetical protein
MTLVMITSDNHAATIIVGSMIAHGSKTLDLACLPHTVSVHVTNNCHSLNIESIELELTVLFQKVFGLRSTHRICMLFPFLAPGPLMSLASIYKSFVVVRLARVEKYILYILLFNLAVPGMVRVRKVP